MSAITLGAVVWWATKQGTPTFPHSTTGLALLATALLVHAVATIARGWRWHVVLRHSDVHHHAVDAYALTCVGYMGNTVLPARGGEALRTVLMSQRSDARKRVILGTIVAERMLDATALAVLFVIVTFAGVAGAPVGLAPAIAAIVGAVVATVALLIYLRGRRAGRWASFADRVRPFVRALRAMLSPAGALLLAFSAGVWLLDGLIFYLVGQSLSLGIGLAEATFLVVLGSFFALIPAAPGYVGTYDAAILFGLRALHISGTASISFTLLVRFVTFFPVTIAGVILLITRYGGLARLRRPSAGTA